MAVSDCTAVILALEEHSILHYSGKEVVVQAKMVKTSQLLGPFGPSDINESLRTLFTSNKQLFLMPVKGGNSLSLEDYSFEQLEGVLAFKPQCERTFIISDEARATYETLRSAYLASTNDDDKSSNLLSLKNLVRSEMFEQISNNNLKGFVFYPNSEEELVLLLENRKVFTADQQKVNAAAARLAKAAQRAALPSTASGVGVIGLTPAGKPRRRIEDDPDEESQDSQEDLHSDVSCPCEGTKTPSGSEHEDDDNVPTPVLNDDHQLIPPIQASLQTLVPFQPFGGQRSQPPVVIGASSPAIPKRKHSSKHKKKSKHSSRRSLAAPANAVPEDLNTKMPAKESASVKKSAKKALKKKKAKKTKQSKRLFKKGVRNQSSSEESDSSEESEEESSYDSSKSSSSEEVSCCIFVFYFPFSLFKHGVTFGGRTLENFKMVDRFQKTLDCHQWITVVEILYFPKQVNHCKSTCRGLLVRPGDLLASELVCPAGSLMLFLTSFLLKEYWLTNVLKVVAKKFFFGK